MADVGSEWTELRFQAGKSDKFWAVRVEGSECLVHYGRTGTKGQRKAKEFPDQAKATAHGEKLLAKKLKRAPTTCTAGRTTSWRRSSPGRSMPRSWASGGSSPRRAVSTRRI
jgi:predicted DNA-binding WGR domain protein